MKAKRLIIMIVLFCMGMAGASWGRELHRVYILTDISSLKSGIGEPDDTQSLIRFLLYANEFKIEGIGATYTSHGNTIYPNLIREVIDAYRVSLPSLQNHGLYPEADELKSKIMRGNPNKGIQYIGEGNDTELSEHLIEVLLKEDDAPLWVLVWGGQLDLAQALWKISQSYSEEKAEKMIQKLRVYAISDQYDKSGNWIREHYKNLFYILNNWSFRGMYRTGDENLVSAKWVQENILSHQAPLARMYPCYKGGDPWGKINGIKEGDTPSFLYLLPKSPGDPEKPQEEHWGGTYQQIQGTNHFTDGEKDSLWQQAANVSKWRQCFQQDFIERLSWLEN